MDHVKLKEFREPLIPHVVEYINVNCWHFSKFISRLSSYLHLFREMTLFCEVGYFLYTDDLSIYMYRLICSVSFSHLLGNIFFFMAYRDFKLNMIKIYPSTQTLSSHCVTTFKGRYHHPSICAQTGHLGVIASISFLSSVGTSPSPIIWLMATFFGGCHGESSASGAILQGVNANCVTLGKRESYLCLIKSNYKWKQKQNQSMNLLIIYKISNTLFIHFF